jgi:hypothetical protein
MPCHIPDPSPSLRIKEIISPITAVSFFTVIRLMGDYRMNTHRKDGARPQAQKLFTALMKPGSSMYSIPHQYTGQFVLLILFKALLPE